MHVWRRKKQRLLIERKALRSQSARRRPSEQASGQGCQPSDQDLVLTWGIQRRGAARKPANPESAVNE
jgi:hypothetical protein